MARQCPLDGEPKLYLDCMECEDRHQCGGTAGNRRQGQGNKQENRQEKENNMGTRPKLLIVDGSSMLATAYFAYMPNEMKFAKSDEEREQHYGKLLHAPDGTYTNAIFGMSVQLSRLLDGWKPDYLAVAFDKTRNTFRRGMYDGYKAQRKETQKPLKEQMILMQDLLSSCGIPVFLSDVYEADDLAGTLACKYKDSMTVRLVSKDKDYLQLVDDAYDVRVWTPAAEKDAEEARKRNALFLGDGFQCPDFMKHLAEYTDEAVFAEKGVYPGNIPDLKAIEGDTSDNIPGVKGVSSAAAPLIREYGGIQGIYDAIDACGGDAKQEKELAAFWKTALSITKSPLNAMKRNREMAFLSLNLATIRTYCDEALGFDLEASPLKNADFQKLNERLLALGIKNARFGAVPQQLCGKWCCHPGSDGEEFRSGQCQAVDRQIQTGFSEEHLEGSLPHGDREDRFHGTAAQGDRKREISGQRPEAVV